MEVQLKETERIDDLQLKGLKLIQDTNGFCFGIDAVLLANFAKVKKGAKVVDLGTGTGIVPILIAGKSQASKIIGVEIQEEVYEMATRSVKLNDLEERVEIVNADIKEIDKVLEVNGYHVVTSNPPYMHMDGIKTVCDYLNLCTDRQNFSAYIDSHIHISQMGSLKQCILPFLHRSHSGISCGISYIPGASTLCIFSVICHRDIVSLCRL